MNFDEVMQHENVEFGDMDPSVFLIGLLSAFDNRLQAKADRFFEEISWKQFFAIICINLCKEPPTIKELAGIMGSSHQNVKQILLKLEKKGFVDILVDQADKRKQRVMLTEKTRVFCEEHDEGSSRIMVQMFKDIPREQILLTVQTIMKMESNLMSIEN